MVRIKINGKVREIDAPEDTPLLWVLRDRLGLTGTKFGCGVAQCGACTVLMNGEATFSCVTPIAAAADAEVTTIEGLSPDGAHPLQRAWVAEQVPQCGYCQSGQIMRAAGLLRRNATPSRDEIVATMTLNLCRCGTYNRIVRAVARAATGQ